MAGTTDFQPFATGVGANVLSQAAYLASSALSTGVQSGTASSALNNKSLRQATFVASALATYVATTLNINVPDDGNLANLVTFIGNALAPTNAQVLSALGYTPVNKAGDTMTGLLTLSGAPTANLHAATKLYVDTGKVVAITALSASRNLIAGDINTILSPNAAGYTLTLPTPTSLGLANGASFRFYSIGYSGTLAPGAGATLLAPDGVSFTGYLIAPGQGVRLVATSTTAWQIVDSAGATSSLTGANALKITAPGGAKVATITANSVVMADANNNLVAQTGVSLTPSLASSGLNGLDTGSVAANTLYSLWAIWNGTTLGAVFSLSATAPTLPSGYVFKAFLGWVLTDGSSNILGFNQLGALFQFIAPQTIMTTGSSAGNISTPTWVAASMSAVVPSNVSSVRVSGSISTSSNLGVAPNNTGYGAYNSGTNSPPIMVGGNVGTVTADLVYEGSNLYYYAGTGGGHISIIGWRLNF